MNRRERLHAALDHVLDHVHGRDFFEPEPKDDWDGWTEPARDGAAGKVWTCPSCGRKWNVETVGSECECGRKVPRSITGDAGTSEGARKAAETRRRGGGQKTFSGIKLSPPMSASKKKKIFGANGPGFSKAQIVKELKRSAPGSERHQYFSEHARGVR